MSTFDYLASKLETILVELEKHKKCSNPNPETIAQLNADAESVADQMDKIF